MASNREDAVRPNGIATQCVVCHKDISTQDNSFAIVKCGICNKAVHCECCPPDDMDACNKCAKEKGTADKKKRKKVRIKEKKDTGIMTMDEDEEARDSKGLPCGVRPSDKEVEDHERTHLPFRSWCPHCVMGRAKSHPHWKQDKEKTGVPVISLDYYYMKDSDKDKDVQGETPILIWKDDNCKGSMSIAVPEKGICEYAIRRASQDINRILGYNKMIFKGDQEPALRSVMERIKMLCGEQCTLDETPVGDSQSNGDV